MLKEIPRGSTFVIRLVEPLKAGFGQFLSAPLFLVFLVFTPLFLDQFLIFVFFSSLQDLLF